MVPQQYCLRWKHHHSNVQSMFAQLLEKGRFCDVTLYCSSSFATQVTNKDTVEPQNIRGESLRAHRVVLAACSELLGALLGAHEALGEPVLVLDGADPGHMRALLDYMYTGEMNVHHSQLAGLLKTAEELRIKGLTDIRWNNKDEPPDCTTGAVTTVTHDKKTEPEKIIRQEKNPYDIKIQDVRSTNKKIKHIKDIKDTKDTSDGDEEKDKFNLNGGPPPLIKLPTKEKVNPMKRDNSEPESPSPKRRRVPSGTEHTDDENNQIKLERDQEWRHGNLDITAERVVGWGGTEGGEGGEGGGWSREPSDDEWDPPADIGSFLHTKLKVDGDNSADEESDGSACAPHASSSSSTASTAHIDYIKPNKSGGQDPRFSEVVKLNDYLQHGRRPQFWEENYVKRVMESVRLKELEMKQAAEILGVSYGTLYGRYRDVYGCINRPYRTARDFWQAKGPSAILERLQRGDLTLEAAALALGVNPGNLASYVADIAEKDIEVDLDPSQKLSSRPFAAAAVLKQRKNDKVLPVKKVGGVADDDLISVNASHENIAAHSTSAGKWPSIRLASLESLREAPPSPPAASPPSPSPSQLMRTRPDLTIVAARKDTESPSPKRRRVPSGTEHTDDENNQIKLERDQEWRHGNMDITAERVVGWGGTEGGEGGEGGGWSREPSDDEWDPPADIGSFLHTKLKVDGDNSADEESDGSACAPHASSSSSTASTAHIDYIKPNKSGGQDPRFSEVVKLNDYLQHGRRPQFWEENYVKRVMESVRLKELEMKQAAEILGVSYGTLYGRYRDVYGCINRPYRTARDFWQAKGPSAILERLQRGDLTLEAAALALGVNPGNLASYVADIAEKDIEVDLDPSQKLSSRPFAAAAVLKQRKNDKVLPVEKVGGVADDDLISVNASHENIAAHSTSAGKWPSIRLASLESLREAPPSPPAASPPSPSPSQLMRTRPDLTIVAARKDT